ncbi:BLUF domain-containing protein [Pseudomonadota bacterium]
MSLFNELKRRNVFKVGIGYVLIAWLLAQVLQLVLESFGTPDWAIKTVLVLLASGLPIALILAWAYEMTPEGLKREKDLPRSQPITLSAIQELKDSRSSDGILYSSIYKSRCRGKANWELMESILASSSRNNPADKITGVLVATETHFLQVLEGEFEPINATMERISRDTRHEKVQLISFAEIQKRRFGDWGMHGIGLFDLHNELTDELRQKFGEEDGNVRLPSTMDEVMELVGILVPEEFAKQDS